VAEHEGRRATLRQVVECPACGFYIGLSPTCDVTGVEIRGGQYERIRYTTYDGKREHTCPECGITALNFHHAGCELEICPPCEGQLAGCECEYVFVRGE
jgi:primosomal protein N'